MAVLMLDRQTGEQVAVKFIERGQLVRWLLACLLACSFACSLACLSACLLVVADCQAAMGLVTQSLPFSVGLVRARRMGALLSCHALLRLLPPLAGGQECGA